MAEGQEFLNIEKIISQLDLNLNMTVADFGAGHGFFSVAVARKIRPSGQVYAIDVLPQAIEAIRSRAKLEGLLNVRPIRGNLEVSGGSTLPDGSCDLVFIANVLFQVPDKNTLLAEAYRVLKPGGHLAVIEWRPYTQVGPQKEHRLTEEEVKQLIMSKGFGEIKTIDAGSHHYGFIFKK
jgi:ubiquinone/menaquinone biosynthesis C-methylase UbiE